MRCPSCQAENAAHQKFCGECGARLQRVCSSCARPWPPEQRFCGECGSALGEAVAPPSRPAAEAPLLPSEGDLRPVTAVACELVVPAEASFEAEELHARLTELVQRARAEVERLGGSVNQVLGRGLVAVLGAPTVHEDHVQRALLVALALARAASTATGDAWPVRLAVDTGAAVVGGGEGMVVGAPLEHARLVASQAPAGRVRVTEAVVRFGAGRFEPVAPASPGELPLWELISLEEGASGPPRAQRQELSPYLGRRRELDVLEELFQEAERGRGQVVGVAGEAGAGKSRLLLELGRRLPAAGVTRLVGRCVSYGGAIPYLPLRDLIRRSACLRDADGAEETLAKLRATLERLGADVEEGLPALAWLLPVKGAANGFATLEPQALKDRLFRTLRQVLLAASRRAPVVLEIEDLHWADETSVDLLASLVESMASARILLLLTYRSGYQPRWMDRSYATQLTLRRLSLADSQALVEGLLGRERVAGRLTAEILEKAEGNPFYLEELARSLPATADDGAAPAVPETIQGLLLARIDRLPPEHKRLLQDASVLGREVPVDLLAEVHGGSAVLSPLLEDLQRWELLVPSTGEGSVPQVSFQHALTQEVAYRSLLPSRRRTLHGLAARAVEALHQDRLEEVYELLVYHYPSAGEVAKTVEYLRLLAARAAREGAYAEAAKALSSALDHAAAWSGVDGARQRAEVRLHLAEALFPLARFGETLETLAAGAADLAEVAEPRLVAEHHFWLAHTYTYLGDQERTREHAHQAVARAAEAGDAATEGKACYVLGRDGFWSGAYEEGMKASLRAVVLLERSGEAWWQGQAYWVLGFHHFALGQPNEALQAFGRCFQIGEALDDYRLDPSWSIGFVLASTGQASAGLEHCRRGLERARDELNHAVALGFYGYAQLQAGDATSARISIQEAREAMQRAGMKPLEAWFGTFLAEALEVLGEAEEANAVAEEAVRVARAVEFRYGLAALAIARETNLG
jgi:class 3 adenylate cyclase/tetratricopeptide (TPR) repeat protein